MTTHYHFHINQLIYVEDKTATINPNVTTSSMIDSHTANELVTTIQSMLHQIEQECEHKNIVEAELLALITQILNSKKKEPALLEWIKPVKSLLEGTVGHLVTSEAIIKINALLHLIK